MVLDKASPPEKETIRALLTELGGLADWGLLFKFEPIPHELLESPEWDRKCWPKETYWVLRFQNGSQLVEQLCEASLLCDCELELGAMFPSAGTFGPKVISQSSFFHYTDAHREGNTQPLEAVDIALIDSLRLRVSEFSALEECDDPRSSIIRLFEQFVSISAGKRSGDLALLGHFALIEGLITHQPHPERGDSINHQLKTKMPLLMRKFRRPLNLGDYVSIEDPGKVWGHLYALRSRIAHGGRGFPRGIDSQLSDPRSVFLLVRESLKRLFVLALHEPEFLIDLRAC